jgi:peptide/nickel transport system substrate-binding protein
MKVRMFYALLIIVMLLAACTPAATPASPADTQAPAATEAPVATEAPAAERPLTLASTIDMRSLDPHVQEGMYPARSVMQWVFDVLVRSKRDGSPVGELATEWKRVDLLTWEFKLAEGVKFQNGEPVNAEAVKFSFERMCNEEHKGFMQVCIQSKFKEAKVIDEYTVQLITEIPAPEILFWLSESFIVPPKYYAETSKEKLALEPIGSGPYKFVEWVKDDHLTFVANEDYWQGAPKIKDVVLRVIPEATTRVNELITGNVDFITDLTPEQMDSITTDVSGPLKIQTWRKIHIGLGQESIEPLKNKLVRQALNYAVDKQAIIDSLLAGGTEPLKSTVNAPQNNPALSPYPYDPEKAKALLAEAGYKDGFKMTLQTGVGLFGNDKDIAQAVGQYFSDIGVETEVQVLENGKFIDDVLRNYNTKDADYMGWGTYIVLGPQLATITCGHLDNETKYCNPEYDKWVKMAIPEEDMAKRQEYSYKAQEILWDDAPWVFLWRLPQFNGMSKRLTWEPHPAMYVDVMEMTLK